MPVFLAALLGGLVSSAGSIAGRVLIALGMGFVSYTGVSATLSYLLGIIQANANSAGGFAVAALGLMQFDTAVGIILGAVSARLLLNGLTSDTIKRLVVK